MYKISRTITTIVFCLITFLFLYFYENDILYVVQNHLSKGQTHYDDIIGAIIFTLALYLIHLLTLAITGLKRLGFGLTFFPSLFLLFLITQLRPDNSISTAFIVVSIILAIVFFFGIWYCRQLSLLPTKTNSMSQLVNSLWVDNLFLVIMFVAFIATTDASEDYHRQAHGERLIKEQRYQEAAEYEYQSLRLRIYAMAVNGTLGDSLFAHSFNATGKDVLPYIENKPLLLSRDSLLKSIGVNPRLGKTVRQQLGYALRQPEHRTVATRLLLSSLLLDRKISDFAETLPRYLFPSDSLPRHYREALYMAKAMELFADKNYNDEEMAKSYAAFQEIHSDSSQSLGDEFEKTYWYYYFLKDK